MVTKPYTSKEEQTMNKVYTIFSELLKQSDGRGPSAGPGECLGHVEYVGEGRTCAGEEVEH